MRHSKLFRLLTLLFAFAMFAAACGSDGGDTDTAAEDEAPAAEPEEEEAPAEEPEEEPEEEAPAEEEPEEEMEQEPEEEMEEEPMEELPTELSGLSIVDDQTFTVALVEADPEFPLRLSYTGFAPLPSVFYDDPVAFEEAPIGNGPFMIDGTWDHDVQIRVVPNPDYAGPVAPSVSSVTFNIYEDVGTTGYLDAQAGVVDVQETIPGDQLATAPDEWGDNYLESPDTGFYYYGFPSYLWDQYPLDLRRALSMAVNRELINDVILNGANIPAASAVPPSLAGSRDVACANWTHDEAAAQQAFADYGGLEALGDEPLTVWFNTSETHAQIAEAVTNMWREVLGIENFVFENLEFSEYLPLLDSQGVTGPFRLGWGADYLSPLNFLEPLYASYSAPPVSSNSSFYNNPDFDQALADGKAAFAASGDLNDAVPFYQAAEDTLCGDVGILPIYFTSNRTVWSDNVDNVYQDAFSNMNWVEMIGGDIVGAIGEPEHLAPPVSNESEGIEVLEILFSQLVEYDHRTSEPSNVVADSITTDDGGQTWTITVADGWTFHDGEAVTAQSFVDAWNWTATADNAAANSGFLGVIEGWDAMNPPSEEE